MSSCSCECDEPEVFRVIWRKARKQHTCCECGSPIDRDERYQYSSGIWQGEPNSFKTCEFCAEKRNEIEDYTDCCVPFGGVWEFYAILEFP